MHSYKLVRTGAQVEIFIDGRATGKIVSANLRNELRNWFASRKLTEAEIDSKVHELYLSNTVSFMAN